MPTRIAPRPLCRRVGSNHQLAAAVLAAALLALGGATASASPGSPVVPPGGTAAGEGYAYWLALEDRLFFDSGGASTTAAHECSTLQGPHGTVTFLNGGDVGGKITCHAPLGQPIYVNGVGNECSTFPGDHKGFGTTPTQLELCARTQFQSAGLHGTATVDNTPVADYRDLITATNAIKVQVPKNNMLGIAGGTGTTADYGEGLLLVGLSAGTHTIQSTSTISGTEHSVDYTLIVT